MSRQILFRNFELLEPSFGEIRSGYQLLAEGDTVRELSEKPIKASGAEVIDCGGRTLMPGLKVHDFISPASRSARRAAIRIRAGAPTGAANVSAATASNSSPPFRTALTKSANLRANRCGKAPTT
jgi:hypothetical protein